MIINYNKIELSSIVILTLKYVYIFKYLIGLVLNNIYVLLYLINDFL